MTSGGPGATGAAAGFLAQAPAAQAPQAGPDDPELGSSWRSRAHAPHSAAAVTT